MRRDHEEAPLRQIERIHWFIVLERQQAKQIEIRGPLPLQVVSNRGFWGSSLTQDALNRITKRWRRQNDYLQLAGRGSYPSIAVRKPCSSASTAKPIGQIMVNYFQKLH
jgi:hypothetical protein